MNIWALCLNFFDCESFFESNSPDIYALCETNLNDSFDSGYFSVRDYLPLIWKDSSTHVHGLAFYMKEGLPFAWDLSLENSADSYLIFLTGFISPSALLLFPLLLTFFVFMHSFYSVSFNIDEVPLINPSANVFAFGDL